MFGILRYTLKNKQNRSNKSNWNSNLPPLTELILFIFVWYFIMSLVTCDDFLKHTEHSQTFPTCLIISFYKILKQDPQNCKTENGSNIPPAWFLDSKNSFLIGLRFLIVKKKQQRAVFLISLSSPQLKNTPFKYQNVEYSCSKSGWGLDDLPRGICCWLLLFLLVFTFDLDGTACFLKFPAIIKMNM